MNYETLLPKIAAKIKKDPLDLQAYDDMLSICKSGEVEDWLIWLKKSAYALEHAIPYAAKLNKLEEARNLIDIHKRTLLALARDDFDSYCLYLEWNREPSKKFYAPRRKVLKRVADALQKLADGDLKLLAISLPPGTGKSTIAIFYLTWIGGKFPDEPILTGSHSNAFVRGTYDECLRILDPEGEYLWHDVFPEVGIAGTNAKDCRIDLGRSKRFQTLEFTSIGSGNAGLFRAQRLLYADDLVSGIEVALSKDRLDKLWQTYTVDLRQRKIGDHCAELHIATRWSVHDVIGRLESEYGNSSEAEFIVMPALNEKDESNFDYAFGLGYTTEFLHEQREIMDDASWRALFMNEPIEREGQLYRADELRRYFELPDREPDAIVAVCDTKDKGTDYAVLPVAYIYGEDCYIHDILCDNSNPDALDVLMENILLKNKVQMCRFESNSAGGRVAQKVQADLKLRGGITKITTKFTTQNKETKILAHSPYVLEHFLFKDESMYKRNDDYGRAINMLCGYTMAGKNKHDDVPDAMAMLSDYVQSMVGMEVKVVKRMF